MSSSPSVRPLVVSRPHCPFDGVVRHEIISDVHNTKKRLDTLFVLPLYTQLFMDIDTGKIGLAVALVIVLPFLLTKRRNIADTAIIGATLAMGKIAWLMAEAAVMLLAVAAFLYWRDKS